MKTNIRQQTLTKRPTKGELRSDKQMQEEIVFFAINNLCEIKKKRHA